MLNILAIVVGYLIGALPMGYIWLRLLKGQDITKFGSGRTGGTNAMRAGGVWLGILTGISDLAKGYVSVLIARALAPDLIWVHVLAGVAAVAGHNWSLWLRIFTKGERFSAGAGTGPNVGAAIAFWWPLVLIEVPVVLFFVFIVGYASVASLMAGLALIVIFALRAYQYGTPVAYIYYSLITFVLVAIALTPNIKRLLSGTERRVGIFSKKAK